MAIPILDVGCGVSVNLNSALSTIDDMINDILNGIGDITGAIADAVASAIGELGTALGKMLPDISGLIPDISLSAGIEGLLDLVEGSLEYLAKLAELTLQFGEAILGAGLSIFDMIADAAAAALKGLNPCSALSTDFAKNADGVVKEAAAAISFPTIASPVEIAPVKTILKRITKPVQTKINIATAPLDVSNRLEDTKNADILFTEDGVAYRNVLNSDGTIAYPIVLLKD